MKKLLIVDDEDAMRGLYRWRLAGTYELFETGDPEQALAIALEQKPDAILLDLKMPKYDGFALCRNFRALSYTTKVPIFVLTGAGGDHKSECEAMGATGYFEKPIDFEKLKQALEASLAAKRSRPANNELRLRIVLKLQGKDAESKDFDELAETEEISEDGFSCISGRNLREGVALDVFLAGRNEVRVGMARPVERVSAGLDRHRYRFLFAGEKKNWIVQSKVGLRPISATSTRSK